VNGRNRKVSAIFFAARRERFVKTKFLRLSGEAFYDWQSGTWSWPNGAWISFGPFRGDFSDWDIYEGDTKEFEDGANEFSVRFLLYEPALVTPTESIEPTLDQLFKQRRKTSSVARAGVTSTPSTAPESGLR
jgi:hypothetical protein